MTKIAVIIPSIGRPTLKRALESLLNQSDSDWTAYVGFDACTPPEPFSDNRINYSYLIKKTGGGHNHGGMVRNHLINLTQADWVCFLDDDDSFRPEYINSLRSEISANPSADCIVFRMSYNLKDRESDLLPTLQNIKNHSAGICQVGISFAVKKSFLTDNGVFFINDGCEDFRLLEKIKKHGGNVFLSSLIMYNVRY